MRVVYSFGQFRMWGEIPDDKVGQPVKMMWPRSRYDQMAMYDPTKNPATATVTTRTMTFEYLQRLDRDLVEYEYAG